MKLKRIFLFYLIAFLIGFLGLSYEILGTKILFSYFSESSQSISIVISSFLLGLSLGALAYTNYFYKIKNKKLFFFISNIISAFLFLILFNQNFLNYFFLQRIYSTILIKIILVSIYIVLPTFFLGFFFPFLIEIISKEKSEKKERKIGFLYFYDLIGSFLGSLIAGFIFIPYLGSSTSLFLLFILHLIISILFFKTKKIIIYGIIILISSFFILNIISSNEIIEPIEIYNNSLYQNNVSGTLFIKNSPYGEVKVKIRNNIKELQIDKLVQCLTKGFDENNVSEIHFVEKPLNHFSYDISALNIGLGCGFTANAITNYNYTKKLDLVEINQIIPEATTFFSNYNNDILNQEKVNLIIEDGFFYLKNNNKKYDFIAIDIQNPSVIHSSNLYTLEGFKYVKENLNEKGIFSFWAYKKNEDYVKVLYNTLNSVFNYVYFKKSGYFEDLYFIASDIELNKTILELNETDLKFIEEIKSNPNKQINTLDKRVLMRIW